MVVIRSTAETAKTKIVTSCIGACICIDSETAVIGRIHADHSPAVDSAFKAFGEGDCDVAAIQTGASHHNGVAYAGTAEDNHVVVCIGSGRSIKHIECATILSDGGGAAVSGAVSRDCKRSRSVGGDTSS